MASDVIAPFLLVMTVIVAGAAVLILRGPLGRALARRIEGTRAAPDDLAPRVTVLEERMDFAERLLTVENTPPHQEIR